ncbi:unnamed protein product (macronuclear) [Paramecium tetraurelia]|uniref:Uncharacterized protein n=1 Tax=Paramecium tetraurelia TaxID=5888 RepID=A0BYQ1_PARTE|nr:uncharacterized protein GSPATT00033521001 [Paramecium tetraurelia]CAK63668.1 unnamed protein product [Paramecium tetraurelia]|eukprot:XP_001431066.1 hypothetical protein (macronuclear) [Paramecium tetraurelia strain d4-2]
MNYANPFSLSSHGSFLSPKETPSILTSFLSQNQSIRSAQSNPIKLSFIQHPKNPKKTDLASPRSKMVTLHEDRKLKNTNFERIKYVSEHSTTPYLCISKKHPQIRIPILPKLSPEPKMEVQRMPYINIMTEPTAAIEEHSDEGRSNGEKSMDNNRSDNLLYVSETSHNFEDQLSTSKLSLKSRFKSAVQKSFRSPPRKSLFNLLISHEFNTLQENERKSIQIKFEPGNQVLATKLIYRKKSKWRQQCIQTQEIKRHSRFINDEQFSISTKAFQRKINLIHGTNSRNLISIESFSLLPKSSRKSAISIVSKLQNNTLSGISDHTIDKNEESELHRNSNKESKPVKFNITVTFQNTDIAAYQFNKPKYTYHHNEEIQQLQSLSPKATPKILPMTLQQSNNHISLVSTKKLDYNSTFVNLKTKRLSRLSVQQGVTQEEVQKIEQQNEFNKPGLFFRVYYQNKLYKLMQKSNYTKENLVEIEQGFRPKFVSPNTNTIMSNAYTMMSTTEQGIRQRKITNEQLSDKIQFLGIKFPKYQIESEKPPFDYNNESSLEGSESSDDSESQVSLNQFLESPLNPNKPLEKNKKPSKRKKSLQEISNEQDDQTHFYNDQPTDQKFIELSTGSLVLIKKIREAFHIPLTIQPILNILESSAKNRLLSYSVSVCEDFHMEIVEDLDQIANQKLLKFQKNSQLNSMIFQAVQIRYSQILIGRYVSQTRMIDVEHQDPVVQTTILEIQEKNDQSQSNQSQSQFSQIKSQKMNSSKEAVKESNSKKPQTGGKIKQSQRYLTKQDSLQVQQYQSWNRRAMQSGDLSNTLQQSNQQNSNFFTQASTVLITKPTQTSQQSVFRVMSSKHIDLNSSQQDASSSLNSSQNEETPQSGQVQKSSQTQTQNQTQPQQPQLIQVQASNQISSGRNLRCLDEDSQQELHEQFDLDHLQNNMNQLSMQMHSLRMRTHIKESSRRQKLDQIQQIKLAIYDHNYTEFIDNIQFIPEAQLDTPLQNGNTFLILAAQCGCSEIVHELIKRGADINIQNDDGNTAVHLALAYGHYKIADLLMEAGGSTHIINRKGQNAWGIL